MRLEVVVREGVLVAEQVVVHLPEAILCSRGFSRLSGVPGMWMLTDQRKVPEHEKEPISVLPD